jgi:hypothetical protein
MRKYRMGEVKSMVRRHQAEKAAPVMNNLSTPGLPLFVRDIPGGGNVCGSAKAAIDKHELSARIPVIGRMGKKRRRGTGDATGNV